MASPHTKESLRVAMKLEREKLSIEGQKQAAQELLQWAPYLSSRFSTWLFYSPIRNEISPLSLFEFAQRNNQTQNIKCLFPKMEVDEIKFAEVKNLGELKPGALTLEPTSKTSTILNSSEFLVLLPGLVFSRLGQRIGYGRGHYDQFLSKHPKPFRLGLAYSFQVQGAWKDEPHDERLDGILTPEGLWGSKRVL